MSSVKLILLLIAMGMVGLVLLLGYKLDKYEEKGKRKDKIVKKQRDNKESDNSNTEFNSFKNDYVEKMEETSAFTNSSFDYDKATLKNDVYSEEFDKTAVIEKIDLSKLEITDDTSYEEPELVEDVEEEIEDNEYEDVYDYESDSNSTMVFDTNAVNEELETISSVKGYDFDDEEAVEEKSKTTRKTTAKKTTTKKAEEKPKTTRKSTAKKTTKKTEEKPKTTRKSTAKKTTTKKVEEKPKTARKSTTKKTTTTAVKTTKKAVKSTKTNTKK